MIECEEFDRTDQYNGDLLPTNINQQKGAVICFFRHSKANISSYNYNTNYQQMRLIPKRGKLVKCVMCDRFWCHKINILLLWKDEGKSNNRTNVR